MKLKYVGEIKNERQHNSKTAEGAIDFCVLSSKRMSLDSFLQKGNMHYLCIVYPTLEIQRQPLTTKKIQEKYI